MSHQRDFKKFYLGVICRYYKSDFPTLLSYTRFLEVMPSVLIPLRFFFTHVKGEPTGIEFIDCTSIKVCHNLRIPRHKVFKGTAARGKGTMGWFYGFKLHIITNHLGDIVAAKLTPANTDDRKPVRELSKGLLDKLYADKGYISKALTGDLKKDGITLVTTQRKNMKPKLLAAWDRAMLSKRFIIETINDQLKNISQIEHSRHRSLHGFMLNLLGGLIAYSLKPEKPSLNITTTEKSGLMAMAYTDLRLSKLNYYSYVLRRFCPEARRRKRLCPKPKRAREYLGRLLRLDTLDLQRYSASFFTNPLTSAIFNRAPMNNHLSPIDKNHLKKLLRSELDPTWSDSLSATPDMSWVTPIVLETLFTELMIHTRGNQTKAAKMLGINRGSFSSKIKRISNHEF